MFISYYFKKTDGVASLRPRALYELLKERGNELILISKYSLKSKNTFFWSINLFVKLLFGKYDKIYVTCGPYTHLPLIIIASLLRKKKIIVDFRDPWSLNIKTNYGKGTRKRFSVKLYISEQIEKLAYKSCDRFWVCTPGMYKEYSTLFDDDTKLEMVLNGHTICNIANTNTPKNKKKKFVCIGKFAEYNYQKADFCLKKIKSIGIDNIELYLIGSNVDINKKLIQENNLINNTYFIKRMPYEDAISFASQCDFGICILRNEELEFGTKVFDYIGLGLPIFDSFDHSSSFYRFFQEYVTDAQSNNILISEDQKMQFSRKAIFLKYVHWLEEN